VAGTTVGENTKGKASEDSHQTRNGRDVLLACTSLVDTAVEAFISLIDAGKNKAVTSDSSI
jgi:hypothetical protein